MPPWKKNPFRSDQITAEQLARFGRYLFLDSKINGSEQHDSFSWVSPLASLTWGGDPAGRPRVIAELQRHAAKGEWEKVGAWKFVREFLDEAPDTQALIDGGLLAIARMRVTNLAVNLALVDTPRYRELVGAPVPFDGFFGPPAFDSRFGPSRQYYLDSAAAEAASRVVARLPHSPGTLPGSVTEAARSMWDFGMLIYRGPLVVNPDLMFEPNVVRPAVTAATGVDHTVFMEMMAAAILDPGNQLHEHSWPSLGGSRFAEDYLCAEVLDAQGYRRLLDAAVGHLIQTGEPGLTVAPGVLTPIQQQRLAEVRRTDGLSGGQFRRRPTGRRGRR
jgi:hypothetical protein